MKSPISVERMDSRRFTEIELRRMLERASGYREDIVVVTAYPVWE